MHDWATGEEGAGFVLSLIIHVLLLAVMAIPVFHSLSEDAGVTTVVQENRRQPVTVSKPINTSLDLPAPDLAGQDELQSKVLTSLNATTDFLPDIKAAEVTSVMGAASGGDSDGEGPNGLRIAEPENAVRAGSFSVWAWPLRSSKTLTGKVLHDEPGSYPRVGQDYHIVIRLRVPPPRKWIYVSDLSGDIVGTDGYEQKIPRHSYYYNSKGDLTPALAGRRIPVIDGTAEILVHVPGALYADVKDAVRVHSDLLEEEQKLNLTFQARR